jgi:hypothetical protein
MKLLVSCLALILHTTASGQQEKYAVKPGEKIADVIGASELFRYDTFGDGVVHFKRGPAASAKMNYNLLTGTVQFLDGNGDTLSIANESNIARIMIGQDTFFFNNGYYRLLQNAGSFLLLEKKLFQVYHQNEGAYGLTTDVSAIDNIGTLVNDRSYGLSTEKHLLIVRLHEFVIADKNAIIIFPDRNRLGRKLSKRKAEINAYLDENITNIRNAESVSKLMNFLITLEK